MRKRAGRTQEERSGRWFVAMAVACVLSAPWRAYAAPCELRFEGPAPPSPAWLAAMREAHEVVDGRESTADCATIAIAITPDGAGAFVTFAMADGREARRRIADASELAPLVRALRIDGTEPAPRGASPIAAVEIAPSTDVPVEVAPLTAPAPVDTLAGDGKTPSGSLLGGIAAGIKGANGDTLSPFAQVMAGFTLGSWELGAFGRWEFEHTVDDDAVRGHLKRAAIGGGAMFGRRQTVGPFVVLVGARGAVLAAESERARPHDGRVASTGTRPEDQFADPRAGLYAGLIVPATARLRVRVQADADASLVPHRSEVPEIPAFPRWTLAFALGVETTFLP